MKNGKYFRLGDFDIWLGYEGEDAKLLRLEWWGNGLRSYSVRLKHLNGRAYKYGFEPMIIENDRGALSVTFLENKSGSILTQLRNKKYGICWFSAIGSFEKSEQERFRHELVSVLARD